MKKEYEIFTWFSEETSKRIRENMHSLRYSRPRGIFVTIARDFQIILKLEILTLTLDFVWVDFYH